MKNQTPKKQVNIHLRSVTHFFALLVSLAVGIVILFGASSAPAIWPFARAAHFQDCATGQGNIFNATTIVKIAPGAVPVGSIVAAFAGGNCVGQVLVGADTTYITAWQAEPTAPDPRGFTEGDTLTYEFFGQVPVITESVHIAIRDGVYELDLIGFGGAVGTDSLEGALATEKEAVRILTLLLDTSNSRLSTRTRQRNEARAEAAAHLAAIDSTIVTLDSLLLGYRD